MEAPRLEAMQHEILTSILDTIPLPLYISSERRWIIRLGSPNPDASSLE